MRLLIFTQKVDSSDPVLGFFCGWIDELAKRFESITVICLQQGYYVPPAHVTVFSLGKEAGSNRLKYIWNFYKYLFFIRGSYDRVFVHMNQEYMILGGWYWKLIGVPVYLWRNHPRGNIVTRVAVWFSTGVFCTSPQSFTARYQKTSLMPVGIDLSVFAPVPGLVRNKNSIVMVGRVAPIKGIDIALVAVKELIQSGTQVSLTIIGSSLPKDESYVQFLKEYVEQESLSSYVQFKDGVLQTKLRDIYSSHEICLNLTEDGSFDKTIVEAAACGAIPVVSNQSLKGILPPVCLVSRTPEGIAFGIQRLFDGAIRAEVSRELPAFAQSQSLDALVKKLTDKLV